MPETNAQISMTIGNVSAIIDIANVLDRTGRALTPDALSQMCKEWNSLTPPITLILEWVDGRISLDVTDRQEDLPAWWNWFTYGT